jgi:hypothetical protein
MMEKCSVCTCGEDEIPRTWLDDIRGMERHARLDSLGSVHSVEEGMVRSGCGSDDDLRPGNKAELVSEQQWVESPDAEAAEHALHSRHGSDDGELADESTACSVFVNLLENPERHTGYAGEAATRVWDAVMRDNCFRTDGAGKKWPDDSSRERRVFYRLISGLRSSISTHIAREYYFGPGYSGPPPLTNTGDIAADELGEWGVNLPLFVDRVGKHPDRLENMYFSFLFVLRASSKLERLIHEGRLIIDSGNATSDASVRDLLLQLSASSRLEHVNAGDTMHLNSLLVTKAAQCRDGFNEQGLFDCSDGSTSEQEQETRLLGELQAKFLNISRIMNCVTCEKCKLWGKLQIMGLGTAVKLLLPSATSGTSDIVINRQELVALINLLNQLGKSVGFAADALPAELRHKLGRFAHVLGYFESVAGGGTADGDFSEPSNQTISSGDVFAPFIGLLRDLVLGTSKRRPASPAIIRNTLQGILMLAFGYVLYQRVRQKLSLDSHKDYEPKL